MLGIIPYKQSKEQYPYRVTAKIRAAFSLGDQPTDESIGWRGYFRNTDPTILHPNSLTFPSINCFIPNNDKIVPRLGTTALGQVTANSFPCIGHKKRFATMGGIEVEVKVSQSGDPNLRDIIEVLYPNPSTGFLQWYQITENVNPLTAGLHRYYMDDWFDTNLNPALSLNLSRLIWVNGLPIIFSWTGGIAPIVSFVPNTSISTTTGITWASLGFVDPSIDPSSSGNIIINGVKYIITGGWATDTLTTASTAGIAVNDVATSEIQADSPQTTTSVSFDVCRQNKNYMFYGNWNARKLYMSNGFSHDVSAEITAVEAIQNDLVLSGTYTGTVQKIIRVTIDSAATPEETFTGTGINDIFWDTSGYAPSVVNTYKVLMVSDEVVPYSGGVGTFVPGDLIVGSVSGASAVVVFNNVSSPGNGTLLVRGISGLFIGTDTITGTSSGATATAGFATLQDGYQVYKNNVIQSIAPWGFTNVLVAPMNTPIPIVDGLTITFQNITGHRIGDFFTLSIGLNDTFSWTIDNVSQASNVIITGAPQFLTDGISIQFLSTTGHTVGNFWEITLNPGVKDAWTSFYYTLPVRKPGEGYIYQLPSNFWAMAPQEEQMYVNTKYGYWSYITTQLSADLQSETVSLTPLKQASSSKVIFPYMISYLEDYIIYVTENKKLDMIGRMKLLQLPQTESLSQAVALDFLEAEFTDGSMEYLDQRLWITSPKDNIMFCYDNQPQNKYWQPPQVIPENGILSIVGNTLISHSNLTQNSFNLFTGTSGDMGSTYTARARTAYLSYGNRWGYKNSNKSFVEGYVSGLPPMKMNIYQGIGGCGGIFPHDIKPITCILPDQAPFGQGNLGSHQNGSDIFQKDSHFYEIFPYDQPILSYRFAALELECTTTNHSYSWLTMGLNEVISNKGNKELINKKPISRI